MSSKLFESYAQIYDSFYIDKDYAFECSNILSFAKSLNPSINKAIEIGAGSGKFTRELAKQLSQVEAFEVSGKMAEICSSNLSGITNVKVHHGDLAKTFNSGLDKNSFDLVIANFHVFTYFSDEEVQQFVEVCNEYLNSGGVACFDFWDYDAVVQTPPTQKEKIAIVGDRKITRKTSPLVLNNFKEIKVNFDFYESSTVLFSENHSMFPRSLEEVVSLFDGDFEFCDSLDIASGLPYSKSSYGNLVFFKKIL